MSNLHSEQEGPPHLIKLQYVHHAGLTRREILAIRICADYTRVEAGQIMNISKFTIKNHLDNVISKLRASSAANAIYLVEKSGLISPEVEAEADDLIRRWWATTPHKEQEVPSFGHAQP
ncbi:MAG TPA: LuxR C-terminal-related transcriptional regulator [Chloroflexia bacterium]|jgi:DNA-binding CsgD family transcriptional regulator